MAYDALTGQATNVRSNGTRNLRLHDSRGDRTVEETQSEALQEPWTETPIGIRPTGFPCDHAPEKTQREQYELVSSQQSLLRTCNGQQLQTALLSTSF